MVIIFFLIVFLGICNEASANLVIHKLWPLYESKEPNYTSRCTTLQVQLEQAIRSYNLKELDNKNNIVKLFDYDSKEIISELRNEHYLGKYYIADCCKICFTDKNYKIYCEYHGSYDGEIPPSDLYFNNKRKDTILYYLINYGFILLFVFVVIRCFKKK